METFTTVSMQYCLNAGYRGLYNRQQVGVTPFFSVPPLTAPTRSTRVLVDFGLCAPTRLFFLTLVSRCWWTLTFALRRYDRQTLLVDFDLCAPTRLVFFILVSHCWWTLTCVLPLVMSFSRVHDVLVKDTLVMDILVTDISVKGHFGKRTFR